MSGQPWMKFFPSDWRADPALRVCSLAARGLWIEMLAIMHEAEPRGHLLVNGQKVTARQLAALTGCLEGEATAHMHELETAGVFSKKKNGVIFSRRMERDEERARKMRENGKLGGNPSLRKHTAFEEQLNPPDIPKKPEARSQKEEPDGSSIQREGVGEGQGADGELADAVPAGGVPASEVPPQTDAQLRAEFEVWYAAYPHKIGPAAARDAYLRARKKTGVSAGELSTGVFRYRADKPVDQKWCNPATWLNQHRWLDQPSPASGAGPPRGRRVNGGTKDLTIREGRYEPDDQNHERGAEPAGAFGDAFERRRRQQAGAADRNPHH